MPGAVAARGTPAVSPIPPGGASVLASSAIFTFALALSRQIAVATFDAPAVASPTLVVNGYNVVPSSTETVTSFYGSWTYGPGGPTLVQGQQRFDLVDPVTGQSAGSFDARVSKGSPFAPSHRYTELLVSATDGSAVGTAAGQLPPVGSIIAGYTTGRLGWSYTAMPSPDGDVVSFILSTPRREITIPIRFNAAEGIADHTVDNRIIGLGNGYSIGPAEPDGETFTATSGVLPFYSTVQGRQLFNVYDSTGNPVGSFEGVFTPTADIAGGRTQAILVTANDGTNVGTAAGQMPPVGSVFNVIFGGEETKYLLYSSMPSPSGDVISLIQVMPRRVIISRQAFVNASTPPFTPPLATPGGNSFHPVSALLPVGVNGLPPREVQIQGYQQFDVRDSAGRRVGSVDADVAVQWDLLGVYSEALLITNVTDGAVGTAAGEVPPVGSVFSFVYFGKSGFGTYYSTMPSPSGYVISYKILTPHGDIPLRSGYNAAAELDDVVFFNPFVSS